MRVYVLLEEMQYESTVVTGVFDSLKKAREAGCDGERLNVQKLKFTKVPAAVKPLTWATQRFYKTDSGDQFFRYIERWDVE